MKRKTKRDGAQLQHLGLLPIENVDPPRDCYVVVVGGHVSIWHAGYSLGSDSELVVGKCGWEPEHLTRRGACLVFVCRSAICAGRQQ